jgi:hypothetical protein
MCSFPMRSLLARPNLPPEQSSEHQVKIGGEIRLACACGRRMSTQYQERIPGKRGNSPAHQFPEPSLHPVANHRRSDRTADNKAYLRRAAGLHLTGREQQCPRDHRATSPAPSAKRALELLRASHPGLLRQHRGCRSRYLAVSDSELVAALAAAGGQDCAAGPAAHPLAEAVDLVPPTVVRLERALAHWSSSTFR